jgi:hypothetical protein
MALLMGPARALVGVLLVSGLGLSCARRSEFIGTVLPDGAGGDGGRDADGPVGEGGNDAPAAVCPVPGVAPIPVPEPRWTCGTGCLEEPSAVSRAVLAAAADEPAGGPEIVYPLEGSVHPINLPRLTLQWRRAVGAGQTAFHISIEPRSHPGTTYEFFVPYQPPPGAAPRPPEEVIYELRPEYWTFVASKLAGEEASIKIAAYDPAANKNAVSAPRTIRFTAAAVEGALHYVTLLAGTPPAADQRGIRRHVMGTSTSELLVRPGTPANPHDCGGCHSLSLDGSRLAFAATYSGNLAVVDTARLDAPLLPPPAPPANSSDAVAPALSPRGDLVFARSGVDGGVTLRSPQGALLHTRTREQMQGRIDYPAWSPTGTELVAGRATGPVQPDEQYLASNGHLVTIPIVNGRIGDPQVLLADPTGLFMYLYPSFSPDGAWVVFVARKLAGSSRSPDSELRLINRQSRQVVTLGSSSPLLAGQATTWPHFAPTGQDGCHKLFLVFQSRLNYGFLVDNTLSNDDGKLPQLWLSQIDLRALEATPVSDPLSPPVWLPFQDPANKNILPYFTR